MKTIYLLVEHLSGNVEQTRHIEYFEALDDAKAHARALFRREGTECTFREVTPHTQYGKARAFLQVIPGNRDTRKFRSLWIPNRIELHYIKPKTQTRQTNEKPTQNTPRTFTSYARRNKRAHGNHTSAPK